jgi:hypothetical protein
VFYAETITSDRYVSQMFHPFFKQLTEEETLYGHRKQDSAAAYSFKYLMQTLNSVW